MRESKIGIMDFTMDKLIDTKKGGYVICRS